MSQPFDKNSEDPRGNGAKLLRAVAWPILMLLGLIMLTALGLVLATLLVPSERAGEISKILGEAHAISRLVALVLIVPLLGVLTIYDKVDGAVAATALSAIAGYVLGSTSAAAP